MTRVYVQVQNALNKTFNVSPILDEIWGRLDNLLTDLESTLGLADLTPPARSARPVLGRAVYANDAHHLPLTGDFTLPPAGPLSATEPLVVNYLNDVRTKSLTALRDSSPTEPQQTLLYHVVRHAKLSAYLRAIEREQDPARLSYHEVAAVAIPANAETCWDRATRPYPQTQRSYLQQYDDLSATAARSNPDLIDFDTGLDVLRTLPSERLDLLFRKTLSLTNTRLDA